MNKDDAFSSSARLESLEISISDDYYETQKTILQKGKIVENFINDYSNNYFNGDKKKGVCFDLLSALFALFKSEFATNLELRRALIRQRENIKKQEFYKNQIRHFLNQIQFYFPKVNSLEKVKKFSKKVLSEINGYSKMRDYHKAFQKLNAQKNDLLNKNEELEKQRKKLTENLEKDLLNSQKNYQELQIEEKDIKNRLSTLDKEKHELENHNFSIVGELQTKVNKIDEQLNRLNSCIQIIKKKNQKHELDLKLRIQKNLSHIKELHKTRTELETELDTVLGKIDFLTNPLSTPNTKFQMQSPHIWRYQLIELEKQHEELQKQLNKDNQEIEDIENQINKYENICDDEKEKMEAGEELQNLTEALQDHQRKFQKIKLGKSQIKDLKEQIKITDEIKRHKNFERIKLKHMVEDLESRWRQLAIDNKSLKKTINYLEQQKQSTQTAFPNYILTDDDKQFFEIALTTLRDLRKELSLSYNMSPHDIASYILEQHNMRQ